MYNNWYGAYNLYLREVRRFLKVYHQTIIAPSLTALLYLAIFYLALGNKHHDIHNISYINFISAGLLIMTIIQNAFANTCSSIIMKKVIGYIIDVLMPPLNASEIVIAYLAGAITRGLLVGLTLAIFMSFFVDFRIYSIALLIFHLFSACIFMGLLGIFAGIAANNFDESAAITSYIVTPLSFLSCTFYSVEKLPEFFQSLNNFNPLFYLIDGFRYSILGYHESNISHGLIFLSIINISLFLFVRHLFHIGWRIKP